MCMHCLVYCVWNNYVVSYCRDTTLQTAAGEGIEKVRGPSTRGERGEGERGPHSWTQEEGLSVAVRLPATQLPLLITTDCDN